jgi:hypothetical protein
VGCDLGGKWADYCQRIIVPIMKRLIVTALLLSLCSCRPSKHDQPEQRQQPEATSPLRAPSATELFDLQSKCTVLGEKILRDNIIGDALTQEQVSHYNPKDNRCYVRLDVHTADLTTSRENYTEDEYLEDGQTDEMLAYVTQKGEKRSGMVFDSSLLGLLKEKQQSDTDPDAINDLIDSFVSTDRRP